MKCHICKKVISGLYCKFVFNNPANNSEIIFYTCWQICSDEFRNNLDEIVDKELPISSRSEILDL
jgi:hypothetical protein